jgi:hypothetical protein
MALESTASIDKKTMRSISPGPNKMPVIAPFKNVNRF